MTKHPMPCSECGIDEEDAGVHHTSCEAFDCTIAVCDPCRMKLIVQGKWVVCEPHEEWPHFDKCKSCYEYENNENGLPYLKKQEREERNNPMEE